MSPPVLEVKNLSKSVSADRLFARRQKRHLWTIPSAVATQTGFYVIAGRNGCGKSTFLRCTLGLLRPDAGDVSWVGGKSIDSKLIGYLPEFPIIPPAATVGNWLAWLLDTPRGTLPELDTQLSRFPTLAVSSLLHVPANRLSKGQQQRVQLWAALARNPSIVVLDEPFSGLDPWARVELAKLLSALLDDGRSLFMSTHELPAELRARTLQTWVLQNQTLDIHDGCTVPS